MCGGWTRSEGEQGQVSSLLLAFLPCLLAKGIRLQTWAVSDLALLVCSSVVLNRHMGAGDHCGTGG